MRLTKEQLLEIKAFIAKRGFDQPDVQMEILDHVASNVEERMTANPTLNFDDALIETHQSFGVMGFSSMADGINHAIYKKYSRMFWGNVLSVFGYEYILLLCLSVFGLYKAQLIFLGESFYVFFVLGMLIVFGVLIFSGIQLSGYKKYKSFQSGASFLSFLGSILIFTNLVVTKTPFEFTFLTIHVQPLVVSILIVFFVIYFNAAMRTVKAGIRDTQALMEKYKMVFN